MEPPALADDPELEERLRVLIRQSPFPLFLVRLSDTVLLEVSRSLEAWAGRDRASLVGSRIEEHVEDAEATQHSMGLLASGVLDAYTRHARYRTPEGPLKDFEVRLTAYIDRLPRRWGVATILTVDDEPPHDLEQPASGPEAMVLGTVDKRWTVDRVTADVSDLLGVPASTLLGQAVFDLVHPEDVSSLLLLAAHAGTRPPGTCGRLRLRDANGSWVQVRLALQPLAGDDVGFAFAITAADVPPPPDSGRTRELEDHLRRIAREVAASGVAAWSTSMPTSAELPALSQLSAREYEIVVRLASGDRVPAIARGLFLSESTVRNHLTSVYRKFGVASQAELLSRLHAIA